MKKLLLASLLLMFGVVLVACDGDESLSAQLFAINNLEDRIDFALENDMAIRVEGSDDYLYIGEELPKEELLALWSMAVGEETMILVDEATSEDSMGNITYTITVRFRNTETREATNPLGISKSDTLENVDEEGIVDGSQAAFQAELDELSTVSEFVNWMNSPEIRVDPIFRDRDRETFSVIGLFGGTGNRATPSPEGQSEGVVDIERLFDKQLLSATIERFSGFGNSIRIYPRLTIDVLIDELEFLVFSSDAEYQSRETEDFAGFTSSITSHNITGGTRGVIQGDINTISDASIQEFVLYFQDQSTFNRHNWVTIHLYQNDAGYDVGYSIANGVISFGEINADGQIGNISRSGIVVTDGSSDLPIIWH